MPPVISETPKNKHLLFQVTRVSKYLAMTLFVLLPFLGAYIGYSLAPVEVQGLQTFANAPKLQTSDFNVENDTYIYNHSGHNLYVVSKDSVGCFTEVDDELTINTIPELDAATFEFIGESYVKDKNSVYKVLCPRTKGEVHISKVDVSDVATLTLVKGLPLGDWDVFYDKDYVYVSLPQEFLLEKREEIDRETFEFIGVGRHRVVDIMEGLTQPTQNSYFKDKAAVYVIDFGHIKKLEVVPETFTIYAYEQASAEAGE